MVRGLLAARTFNQGYETVRYAASALVDPGRTPPTRRRCRTSPRSSRRSWLASTPAAIGMNHRLAHFQHLFAGSGYAAGYYNLPVGRGARRGRVRGLRQAGDPFDPVVAARLQRFIYSAGNSLEPGAAYRAFRGPRTGGRADAEQRRLLAVDPPGSRARRVRPPGTPSLRA